MNCKLLFGIPLLLAGAACFPASHPCTASTCTGCCDAKGVCQPGAGAASVGACGSGGAACLSCTSGQICSDQGVCQGQGGCTAANCPGGCCAPNGQCISPANTVYACGAHGSSCQVCTGDQMCTGGSCGNTGNCSGCVDGTGTCQNGDNTASCGSNGQACQTCGEGQSCTAGACTGTCVPNCAGKQCGSDGCNGTCGTCAQGDSCLANGTCASCTPSCTGKQCGSDSCGGQCGSCPSGQSCNGSGQCATATPGTVGPNGGTVPSLYFAVLGDTRPGSNNAPPSSYPTAIITKLYQDIEALNPKPQFVLTTGDYQFDDPGSGNAAVQIGLYKTASQAYTGGPIFSAMGNHECNGFTASNMNLSTGQCDGVTSDNYSEWFKAFVQPLGKTLPYYTIPINATDGSWTSKFIIVACNAWDSTQQSWLQQQLAMPTTYTFLVRHEDPTANTGPCVSQMDSMLQTATYNALIVGHVHQFCSGSLSSVTKCTYPASNVKFFVVGNGGASTSNDGYVTVQQNGSQFTVTDFDSSSNSQVATFTF